MCQRVRNEGILDDKCVQPNEGHYHAPDLEGGKNRRRATGTKQTEISTTYDPVM